MVAELKLIEGVVILDAELGAVGTGQVPEEYLKAEEQERKGKKQKEIRIGKERKEEKEQRERQKEAEKLDKIYNSLDPLKQEEIKKELENRLSAFWRKQFKKEMGNGEISKLTKVALESKKSEVVKDWIKEGKIKG